MFPAELRQTGSEKLSVQVKSDSLYMVKVFHIFASLLINGIQEN